MNKIKYFYTIFLLLLIIGCKENKIEAQANVDNKVEVVTTNVIDLSNDKELEKIIKTKNRIFLKYWSGMTFDEYFYVSELLVKEGSIKKDGGAYAYTTSDCQVVVEPIMKNKLVVGIDLTEGSVSGYSIECIYPFYQKKYKLQSMVDKNLLVSVHTENNPQYSPVMSYTKDYKTINLPNAYVDKSESLNPNKIIKFDVNSTEYRDFRRGKFLPKDKIVIDNDSVVVLISQEIKIDENPYIEYSLTNSEEIKAYELTEQGKQGSGFNGNERNYQITNSKTRKVYVSKYAVLKISYFSKEEFQKEENVKRIQLDSIKNANIKTKQQEKESNKRVLNDI
tara:strand:+ start:5490 stop:6497 length:1008 start_codon:yes stop_codon:yes gene_type:complete